MTNNTPSGAKKHCESTKPESCQTAKIFFFLLFLRLPQTGLNWDSFMMALAQNSSILHWAVHQPVTFHNWSLMRWFEPVNEELYGFICDAIFFIVYMCTNHLATKQLLFNIAEIEIWLCVW